MGFQREECSLVLLIVILFVFGYIGLNKEMQLSRVFLLQKEDFRIDINKASWQELDLLPGIGPVTAKKIIEQRQMTGGFKNMHEIKHIRKSLINKIKERIIIN